jgi:hypothetical protein
MKKILSLMALLSIPSIFYGMNKEEDENRSIEILRYSRENLSAMPSLKSYTNVTGIDFSYNTITTLDWIHELPNLIYLDGTANNINSIEPLENCKNLKYVMLNANKIKDPTPFIKISNQLKHISIGLNPLDLEKLETILNFFKKLELTPQRINIIYGLLINKYNGTLDKYSDKINTTEDFENNEMIKKELKNIQKEKSFYSQKDHQFADMIMNHLKNDD